MPQQLPRDPIAEALGPSQSPDPILAALQDTAPDARGADRGVLAALEQGRMADLSDLGASAGWVLETVTQAPGLRHLFRALRAPQQALVLGPLRGAADAIRKGRPVGPLDLVRGSARGVREDIGGREVATAAGIEGTTGSLIGLGLELAFDPLWLLAPAKLAKVARLPQLARAAPIQGAIQTVKETRPAQVLGRAFITDFGKPAEYVELAERRVRDVANATERAVELGRRIAQLPAPEQRAVREFMEAGSQEARTATLAKAAESGADADRIGQIGTEAMQRDIALGQELVDAGLMSERTFQKWRGKHIRREFEKYENPVAYLTRLATRDPEAAARAEATLKAQAGFVGDTTPLRERLSFLKQRKDLSDEIRQELGEILEAAHPVAKGQALAGQAVATRRMFQETARRFASDTLQPGYKYAGDSKGLGPLAGTYLPEAVADDVNRIIARPGEAQRLWRQGVGWWKYGKVVLNPATHARNIVSNLILADMAGLSPFRAHRYAQAARSLATQDRWFQEAKEAGSFLQNTFAGTELPKMLDTAHDVNSLQRGVSRLRTLVSAPGTAYQFEEHLFKMAFYIDKRKAGLMPKAAADAAEQALFNYRRVPQFIDTLRRTGVVPFVTFPYKALPATGRALTQRPAAVNRYGNIFRTFEARDGQDERKALPEYMRDGWMRLPGTDTSGRVRYLNLSYVLPFGDIGELTTGGGFMGRGGAAAGIVSSPIAQLAAAVVTGRDGFTNQEIGDQYGGWRAYIQRFLAPPLLGGHGSTELWASAKGVPINPLSRRAEPRSFPQAVLANFAGVRIRPIDLSQERQRRLQELTWDARDIHADMRRYQRSPWLTDDERESALAEQAERLRTLVQEASELRGLAFPDTTDQGTTDPIAEALEATAP